MTRKYLLCAKTDPATRKSKKHYFTSVTCVPHNYLTNFSCSENKTTTQCWHTQGIGPTGGYLKSFPPTQYWHSCLRHLPCCQRGWYDWDAQRIGQGIVSCFELGPPSLCSSSCLWVPPPPVLNLVHLLYIFWGRKEEGKGWKFPVGGVTLRLTQHFVSSHSGKHWLVPKLHLSTTSVCVDFT